MDKEITAAREEHAEDNRKLVEAARRLVNGVGEKGKGEE